MQWPPFLIINGVVSLGIKFLLNPLFDPDSEKVYAVYRMKTKIGILPLLDDNSTYELILEY